MGVEKLPINATTRAQILNVNKEMESERTKMLDTGKIGQDKKYLRDRDKGKAWGELGRVQHEEDPV